MVNEEQGLIKRQEENRLSELKKAGVIEREEGLERIINVIETGDAMIKILIGDRGGVGIQSAGVIVAPMRENLRLALEDWEDYLPELIINAVVKMTEKKE